MNENERYVCVLAKHLNICCLLRGRTSTNVCGQIAYHDFAGFAAVGVTETVDANNFGGSHAHQTFERFLQKIANENKIA